MSEQASLEQRQFELDAEIRRREITLKEIHAKRKGFTTEQATIIGAILALLSGTVGAWIGSQSNITIAEVERITGKEIEQEKSFGTITVDKFRLQRDLVLKAIDKKTPTEVRNTLKFFADSGLIDEYETKITAYLDETNDAELPTGDRLGNLIINEYINRVKVYWPLLDLIGNSETRGNYNAYYGNLENGNSPRLTRMKINEVLAWQDNLVANGAESSAAGKYRYLRKTIRSLISEVGLTGSEIFSPLNQDILAVRLLERRNIQKFISGEINEVTFGNNLAKEWATLPLMNGPFKGQTNYRNGLNKAVASVDEVNSALLEIKSGILHIAN